MPTTHLITGTARSGKTRILEQIIAAEKLTHGPAVTLWGIETARPGHLTGLDRATDTAGAVRLLTEASATAGQRLRESANHRGEYEPSAAEPRIHLIIDGAEPLLADPEAAGLLQFLAATGRKTGVETTLTATDTRLDTWPPTLLRRFTSDAVTQLEAASRTED